MSNDLIAAIICITDAQGRTSGTGIIVSTDGFTLARILWGAATGKGGFHA